MANDPTKIDWSQLDDLTFQSEATPLETDSIPLWRDNTTGVLRTTLQEIIDLVPDAVAALSGGLDAKDDLTSQVDGERSSWMLSVTPASQDNLLVVIGNAVLTAGYSLSGKILTLVSAPAAGTPLVVYVLSDPIPASAGGNVGNVQFKSVSGGTDGEDGFDYDKDTNTLTVGNIESPGTINGRDITADGDALDGILNSPYSLDSRYYTEAEIDGFLAGVGGGGSVASIFGRTGIVVAQTGDYTAEQVSETAAAKIMTSAERDKLTLIEPSATADQTDVEIITAVENETGVIYAYPAGGGAGIQSAINSGAKRIILTPGTYTVTAPIVLNDGQTLEGCSGFDDVILSGSNVTGGIIEPNSSYAATAKTRLKIQNLFITGTADYGIRLINCTSSEVRNIRFSFGASAGVSDLTNDCLYLGDSWECKLSFISAYVETATTTPARSVVWLDGAINSLLLEVLRTTAATQYGVFIGNVETDTTSATPCAVTINNATLQRQQIGIYARRCTGVTATGIYTEETQRPIVLGSDTTTDRATGFVCTGSRFLTLNASSWGWGANATGAVEAIRAHGGSFIDCNFSDYLGSPSYKMLYVKRAYGTKVQNPSRYNYANSDMRPAVAFDGAAVADSSFTIEGNGTYGKQTLRGLGTTIVSEEIGTEIPVSGDYLVGDRVRDIDPASGADNGWVCTVAGTPGTWAAIAGGGGGSGTSTILWASKVESKDISGGGFAEVVLTNATGATPTGYVVGEVDIPTDDDDVSAWARITANGTITIRVTTIGPDITVSGTWRVPFYPKTSYSWFSETVNTTVGADFVTVTVPAVGVTNATHIAKFIYLPTTSARLNSWATVGTDEIYVTVENTDAPGVLLDGDVEVVAQLKSAAFPDSVTANTAAVANYTALIASTEQTKLVYMKCYSVSDDGGGGWFEARESGATVDYGHVMAHDSGGDWRFHRLGINQGIANVCHFGAFASGDHTHRTTNTTAIKRAVAYLESLAAAEGGEDFTLLFPKGKGFFSIDDEITFTDNLQGLKIRAGEDSHGHIQQYTTGKGVFIFTKTTVGSNHYRLIELHHMTVSWRVQQTLSNFRANAIMITNAPSGSGGMVFGFDIRHCKFMFGRCVFTLLQAPLEAADPTNPWTGTEPDAYTSAGSSFIQSVTFDDIKVEQMSAGLYHVWDEAAGGPQLTFENIKHTGGYPGTDILERDLISCRHNQMVTIEQLEHLWSTYGIFYCGDAEIVQIRGITVENTTLENGTQLMRFNAEGTKFTLDGFRWKNSVIPTTKGVVGVFKATGHVTGAVEFDAVTQTTGTVYLVQRYGGAVEANVGVDVAASTTGLTTYFTWPTADNSNIGDYPTFGTTPNTSG